MNGEPLAREMKRGSAMGLARNELVSASIERDWSMTDHNWSIS